MVRAGLFYWDCIRIQKIRFWLELEVTTVNGARAVFIHFGISLRPNLVGLYTFYFIEMLNLEVGFGIGYPRYIQMCPQIHKAKTGNTSPPYCSNKQYLSCWWSVTWFVLLKKFDHVTTFVINHPRIICVKWNVKYLVLTMIFVLKSVIFAILKCVLVKTYTWHQN